MDFYSSLHYQSPLGQYVIHLFIQQIFIKHLCIVWSFPDGLVVKNLSGNAGDAGGMQETFRRHGYYPWVAKIP